MKKKTLTNLAWSNLKKDRTSSILLILSILITTILLTSIVVLSNGIMKNEKANAEFIYGRYDGIFQRVGKKNIEQMKFRSEFVEIGLFAVLGEGKALDNDNISLFWADKKALDMMNIGDDFIEGGYPKEKDEIAGEVSFFKELGVKNPKIGDKVTLPYRISQKEPYAPTVFQISGLLKSSRKESNAKSYAGYISENLFKESFSETERSYNTLFSLDESLPIDSDSAEEYILELAEKCGVDEKFAVANSGYLRQKLNPGTETIVISGSIAILVIVFSVIVIYNIFHVGIVKKVQEYGKLKAIGTTRKQMKRVIFTEGMTLAVIGVPIGVVLGYFTGFLALRFMLRLSGLTDLSDKIVMVSPFSFPLLILAAMLAFLTVFIAIRKPMKIVAVISPIEAMRYQESSKRSGIRKGKKEMNTFRLTWASLMENRKRTISTMLAMGLSGVLFLLVANFMGNMDAAYDARNTVEHGQIKVSLDYSMNDEAYPENNLDSILANNPFDADVMGKIRKISGVQEVKTQNLLYTELEDEKGNKTGQKASVVVMNREDFNYKAKDSAVIGNFDYDSTTKENGIVHGWSHFMEEEGYTLGQKLHLNVRDGEKDYMFQPILSGAFGSISGSFAITEDTYIAMNLKGNMTAVVWIDCNPKEVKDILNELNIILSKSDKVEFETYQEALDISENSMLLMKSICYSFAILIGIVSFFNMANTIITGVMTRKQEFGVMQAIGMTNGQLNKSLQMEGIIFTIGTVLTSLLVGCPLGYLIFCYGKENGWIGLYNYHFPWLQTFLMMMCIFIMQMILSYILSRNVKKESLVERIRYQE